jgi:hypothetical protein
MMIKKFGFPREALTISSTSVLVHNLTNCMSGIKLSKNPEIVD